MRASKLTSDQFKEWRMKRGMSQDACARCIGISKSTVALYEIGKRREGVVVIPYTVALAMNCIENNLPPYGETL